MGNYYAKPRAQQIYNEMLGSRKSATVKLLFEPGNKYDVNAIAVYDDIGMNMLGHLDRASAAMVTNIVHDVLDLCKVPRLSKTDYRISAMAKTVGDRIYVKPAVCELINKGK